MNSHNHRTSAIWIACAVLVGSLGGPRVEAAQTTFQITRATSANQDRSPWADRTCDGGYIVSSYHASDGQLNQGCIFKLGADGGVQWERILRKTGSQTGNTGLIPMTVKQVSDRGYLIAGYVFGNGLTQGTWLCKLDSSGSVEWSRAYSGEAFSSSQDRVGFDETPDGGFIVTSVIQGTGDADQAPMLLRTDRNGILIWSKYYTDSRYTNTYGTFNDVKVTQDGNFIACGNTCSDVNGQRQTLLVKTDPNGTILWSRTYDLPGYDLAHGLDVAANGDYLIIGTKDIGEGAATFVLRVNAAGNVSWYRTFAAFISQYGSIRELQGGDIVLGGTDASSGVDNWDPSLLRLNSAGLVQWCKAYGYAPGLTDIGYNAVPAADGGFFLGAETRTASANQIDYYDLYFIKTDASGSSGCHERDHDPLPGVDTPSVLDVTFNSPALTYQAPIDLLVDAPNSQETVLCRDVVPLPCVPPPPGLVAWWPFDEGTGTSAAELIYGNTGTHHNGPIPSPGVVACALGFDGQNDYVQVPNHPALNFPAGKFSVDFWIYPQPGETTGTLVRKGVPTGSLPLGSAGYHLYYSNGHILACFANGSSGIQVDLSPNFTDHVIQGKWTFVAVTVDLEAHIARLYVNGLPVQVTQLGPSSYDTSNTEPLIIGGYEAGTFPAASFRGSLDELELFNRVLSDADVDAIYQAGSGGKCKGCLPDLWMKDTMAPDLPEDFGTEPNTVSPLLYISQDIWVRQDADGLTGTSQNPGPDTIPYYAHEHMHENPLYLDATQPNYVYVKVRNRGCTASTGSEVLRVYWADASTGLPWPGTGVWHEIDCVAGGGITPCPLPVIGPSQDYVARLAWVPPDPGAGHEHVCLVARIETTPVSPFGMTYPEGPTLWENVGRNNNIAWKNTTVVSQIKSGGHVIVRNTLAVSSMLALRFSVPPAELANHFLLHGTIKVNLGAALMQKWLQGGQPAVGFAVVGNTTQIQITDPANAVLDGLQFAADEEQTIEVQMQLNPGDASPAGTTFNWDVFQLLPLTPGDPPSRIGGERYNFVVLERDTDGDGMPDLWEMSHSLNSNDPLDAASDLDGDGQTNLHEYLAGTDPNDSHSRLRLQVVGFEAGSIRLRFEAISNHSYTLEWTPVLPSGPPSAGVPWTEIYKEPALPADHIVELEVPSGGQPKGFFRVRTP